MAGAQRRIHDSARSYRSPSSDALTTRDAQSADTMARTTGRRRFTTRARAGRCCVRDYSRRGRTSGATSEDELVAALATATGNEPVEHEPACPVEVEDLLWLGRLERVATDPVDPVMIHRHAAHPLLITIARERIP